MTLNVNCTGTHGHTTVWITALVHSHTPLLRDGASIAVSFTQRQLPFDRNQFCHRRPFIGSFSDTAANWTPENYSSNHNNKNYNITINAFWYFTMLHKLKNFTCKNHRNANDVTMQGKVLPELRLTTAISPVVIGGRDLIARRHCVG